MFKRQRLWLLGIAFLAIVGFTAAQTDNRPVVIEGATLIDGTGKPPQKNVSIVINGGRIRTIASQVTPPPRARIISGAGKFIIPGLVDDRVQVGPSPGNRVDRDEVRIKQRIDTLRALLAAGVTTARIYQGDFDEQTLYLRWSEEQLLFAPRLILGGPTFTAPNGHPTEQYAIVATNTRRRETREVANADEAQQKARELAHSGLTVFEAVYDRGPDQEPYPRLDKDALKAIIDEAHGHDLKIFCDVGRSDEAATAVALGADSIEGVWEEALPDNVLTEMSRKNIFFIPALDEQGDLVNLVEPSNLKAYLAEPIVERTVSSTIKKGLASDHGVIPELRQSISETPSLRKLLEEQQNRAFANVRRAHALGVPLAVGTGSGSPLVFPGAAVHHEMELLVRAGLSPLDAIVSATRNSAQSLGQGSEVGTVEVGKQADMLVLSGDPLVDIRNTQKIEFVIEDGTVLQTSDLIVP